MEGELGGRVKWPPGEGAPGSGWENLTGDEEGEDEEEEEEDEYVEPPRKPECVHCMGLMNPAGHPDRLGRPFKQMVLSTALGQLTVRDISVAPEPPKEELATADKKRKDLRLLNDRDKHKSRISLKLGPQKWSGWVYLDEIERAKIEKKHKEELEKALKARRLWKIFNKKRDEHNVSLRSAISGPDWFQDLSFAQMEAVDELEEGMRSDVEGGGPFRTQALVFKLGVTPPLTPEAFTKCILKSQCDPIRFLYLVHRIIVRREQREYEQKYEQAKKAGNMISPFSLNERLLLSGVFHSHYKHFLMKLDKILPKPRPAPDVRWAAKPKKPKKTYPSPYLEPQPMKEKCWYEERAEADVFNSIKSIVLKQRDRIRQAKSRRLMEECIMKEEAEKARVKAEHAKMIARQEECARRRAARVTEIKQEKPACKAEEPEFTEYDVVEDEEEGEGEEIPEDEVDPCEVIAEWEMFIDDGGEADAVRTNRTPPMVPAGGRLEVVMAHAASQTKSVAGGFYLEDLTTKAQWERDGQVDRSGPEYDPNEFKPFTLRMAAKFWSGGTVRCFGVQTKWTHDFEPLNLSHLFAPEVIQQEAAGEGGEEEATPQKEAEVPPPPPPPSQPEPAPEQRGRLRVPSVWDERLPLRSLVKLTLPEEPECKFNKKPFNVECSDEACELLNADEVPMDEFELARRQIAILPEDKQLEAAVKYLCDRGDPLAILPLVEKVPWLTRWFEKRRGIKTKLTQEDKDELMTRSKQMWEAPSAVVTSVPLPELPLTAHQIGKLTYDDLETTRKLVKKNVGKFFSEVKQLLVGNSRDMYPSMFNEYFNTPLNTMFRTTYFMYMPSREADAIVYRLWKPGEHPEPAEEQ